MEDIISNNIESLIFDAERIFPHQISLNEKLTIDMYQWLTSNVGRCFLNSNDKSEWVYFFKQDKIVIAFKNIDHAVDFSLRWG